MNEDTIGTLEILVICTFLVAASGAVIAFCVKRRSLLSGDRPKHRKEAWWMVPATALLAYGSIFLTGLAKEGLLLFGLGIFGCIYYSGVLIFIRRTI